MTQLSKLMESLTLTEEEAKTALQIAQAEKDAAFRRETYWKKVNQESVYQSPDFETLSVLFKRSYRERNGVVFEETDENKGLIEQLCLYFSNNDKFKGSLDKGLLIQGPVGCGKTSIMKAFQNIGFRSFGIIECKELERVYDKDGFAKLEKYCSINLDWQKREHGWLFDDLGWESKGKHYGKEANVMEEILESINNRNSWRCFHITTNDSIDSIGEKYGDRILSRMKMMFNQLDYSPEAKDMRK